MDIVCLSHLRWNFVFQRPQQLLSRAAKQGRVFYVEEPVLHDGPTELGIERHTGVHVVTPRLSRSCSESAQTTAQRGAVDALLRAHDVDDYVLWYYTPMALPFTHHLNPMCVVYDCMDELSLFADAPQQLCDLESELFRRADIVFTGGHSLYEAKRGRHANVHPFPSSVDVEHFARARRLTVDQADQAAIPHPRIGFFGVIDERMDYDLVRGLASARPDWHLVLVGPTAKVDQASLPKGDNIHYLGARKYEQLPDYIAGWDVAILPFARNDATRFISPTKTPEYLAAGRPVVSTSIRDVVRPYGQQGLARIADTVPEFVSAVEAALAEDATERLRASDAFLTHMSWDGTWAQMRRLVETGIADRQSQVAATKLNAS